MRNLHRPTIFQLGFPNSVNGGSVNEHDLQARVGTTSNEHFDLLRFVSDIVRVQLDLGLRGSGLYHRRSSDLHARPSTACYAIPERHKADLGAARANLGCFAFPDVAYYIRLASSPDSCSTDS